MKLHIVSKQRISSALCISIEYDIAKAFSTLITINDSFIINDSKWFAFNDRKAITPCVMNAANFISGKFLQSLKDLGWNKQPKLANTSIEDQELDAYIEFPSDSRSFCRVREDDFPRFFYEYFHQNQLQLKSTLSNSVDVLFSTMYHAYCRRAVPFDDIIISRDLRVFFQNSQPTHESIRVGLEFETGNIASSFRAINKLNLLYSENLIDVGVFITCLNKSNAATRIWPVSNRNGSFEELQNRDYKNRVIVPLLEIGFEPDGFCKQAPYLSSKGSLYFPQLTDNSFNVNGIMYKEYITDTNKAVLQPI